MFGGFRWFSVVGFGLMLVCFGSVIFCGVGIIYYFA